MSGIAVNVAHGPAGVEERVFFQGDDRLEGMLGRPDDAAGAVDEAPQTGPAGRSPGVIGGVVIAHPYPPHGATMAVPAVYRIAQSCRARGLMSLRFNFRGVEGSRGSFSGTEEHRDVEAAAAFLRGRLAALEGETVPGPETPPVALAGYSFGSAMAARAAADLGYVQALALIAFPLNWPEVPSDTLERLGPFRGPVLALCPENDHLSRPEEVERVLTGLGLDLTLEVVEGADHFLQGRHREVGESVAAFLSKALTLAHGRY